MVGVALVAVSGLLGATLIGGGDAPAGVWAARSALSAGQTVSASDLVRREVRFADQRDADRYVAADATLPDGTVLARDVGAGELLPRAILSGGSGRAVVEVPLSVPAEALPLTVAPGSVVDVWVTPDPALAPTAERGPHDGESSLAFSGVRVLAVSRSGGALGPTATRQVVVGVEPGQEDTLPASLAMVARGTVVLVRRP